MADGTTSVSCSVRGSSGVEVVQERHHESSDNINITILGFAPQTVAACTSLRV